MGDRDTSAVAAWLMRDGARAGVPPQHAIAEMCERLIADGLPLHRFALYLRLLHPEVHGGSFIWRPGAPVQIESSPHEFKATEEYRQSLVVHIMETLKAPLRRHLADPGCPMDFPVLAEFRDEGITDYLATPLFFTDDTMHLATWCTRQPGGFTAVELAGLETLAQPLARSVEIRTLRRTTANLLQTYIGKHAGARVLAGRIRRGDTEAINAAIWLSDMRGFTTRADRMPPAALIDLLNRYFDCQVPVIAAHGGEVLKYMGDGLLAIFPIAEVERDTSATCRKALGAAREARERIGQIAAADDDPLRFGIALHQGEVQYGNIGSGARLDFTCIGPAVNLAARMERLAGALGRTIIGSAEFARHCGDEMMPVGAFALPGLTFQQPVYGLADEDMSRRSN